MHAETIDKYKINNSKSKKYDIQVRYLELLSFVSTSCYWSRYNYDYNLDKFKQNCITGKYLNSFKIC